MRNLWICRRSLNRWGWPMLLAWLILISWLSHAYAAEQFETGIASWYGGGEKLNEFTANGERFDPNALTCASWNYLMGTFLKLEQIGGSQKEGLNKSVIVRVNDRGPAKRLNRAIDLTPAAFSQLASLEKGLIQVRIRVVQPQEVR